MVFTLLMASTAFAEQSVMFSGFGTLGAVYSDSDVYGYRKDVSFNKGVFDGDVNFKTNSLLGAQIDVNLLTDVDIVIQGVLKDVPKDTFNRYITLAFIRYDLSPSWQFRVGRTAADVYLITEFRDVNFSYTWANAPTEVYGINPFKSLDGGDVTYSTRIANGTFSAKIFAGSAESEISSIQVVEDVALDNVYGVSLTYDEFDWLIQIKRTEVKIGNESETNLQLIAALQEIPDFLWPSADSFTETMRTKDARVAYTSVNGKYLTGNWLLNAELAHINSASDVIPDITSAYTSIAYELLDNTFYGVYGLIKSDRYVFDEPDANTELLLPIISAISGARNFYSANQKTLSLGWRYNFNTHMALTAQWSNTKIEDTGGTLWLRKANNAPAETVNTYQLNMSFTY